jgi:hypothetical protein
MGNDTTSQIDDLEKASRRSAIFGGFGLSVVAVSLAVSTGMLHRATTQLTLKAHELTRLQSELESERRALSNAETSRREALLEVENLAADIETKTGELTSATDRLAAVRQAVVELGPPSLMKRLEGILPDVPRPRGADVPRDDLARVQLSATPTSEKVGEPSLYDIRIWLELPKEWADSVLKVQYFFDEPSLSAKSKTSFDHAKQFEVRYRAWGCTENVNVVLFERSGARHEIPFDMCSAPGWGSNPRSSSAEQRRP